MLLLLLIFHLCNCLGKLDSDNNVVELLAFVLQACLEQFSYSSEAVINAVLDDNLPTCLAALDRAMPR